MNRIEKMLDSQDINEIPQNFVNKMIPKRTMCKIKTLWLIWNEFNDIKDDYSAKYKAIAFLSNKYCLSHNTVLVFIQKVKTALK